MALPFVLAQKTAAAPNNQQTSTSVILCHAHGDGSYDQKTVDDDAVTQQGHDQHSPGGHGDIIPPFGDYPGRNWDAAGQAIWRNGCQTGDVQGDECSVGPGWAFNVVDSDQGTTKNGGAVLAARSNPDSVLEATDNVFFSLGKNGWITVEFNGYVVNEAGDDLTFQEITNSPYPEEKARVEVSQDGSTWEEAGFVTNNGGVGGGDGIDISATTFDWIRYARVTDTTNFALHNNQSDGYDFDSVAVDIVCEEPQPEVPQVQPCEVTSSVVTTDLSTWDLSQTRSAGHNELVNDGLHIWTDDTSSNAKAAGYFTTTFPLSGLGDQTIADSIDYEATMGITPGLQLVIDFDNNGVVDGILVGEAVYGNDWWTPGSTVLPAPGTAPQTGGGFGSGRHGTINEWLVMYPNAQVKAIGYSLGSGVHGNGIIRRITLGCVNYTFDLPVLSATVVASKIICEEESSLPNWGTGGPDITSASFADEWVAQHPGCVLADNWDYQYRLSGDSTEPTGYGEIADWNTFTNSTDVELNGNTTIQVREVLPEDYIPFTGWNSTDNVSAEFYCHTDVANYDNWEWIQNPQADSTYYCVAWNVPVEQTFDLHAAKIVCKSETDLPNWGDGDADITASTATAYVAASNGNCQLADWDFEWSQDGVGNPGDNLANGGAGWNGFTNGTATLSLDDAGSRIWVREVTDANYIPFTGQNTTQDVSAEIYCGNDVLNYDNWEWIDVQADGDYYCVAFNVLKPAVLSATKIICDDEEYLPNWGDGSHADMTATTADEFLAEGDNSEHCAKADWDFQWKAGTEDPADHEAEIAGWNTFSGSAEVNTAVYGNTVSVREVFDTDYITFTGQNTDQNVSAEIYCGDDVLHYDNWEILGNLQPNTTYHCVAWNVLADSDEEPEEPNNGGGGQVLGECDLDNDGISDKNCEVLGRGQGGQVLGASTDGLTNTGTQNGGVIILAAAGLMGIALLAIRRRQED